ncbi:TPA: hypothetical protein ACP4WM_000233 [Escherichia coli]|uniref:hypothetical protein n=1 Tax=Escherichia coli TaxID=562 RepID=UPI0006A23216|nr:hypothetical protein [Escherichia coli]EFH2872235.1 hypothetical protein [Escherichia coli]EFH7367356.1 hypothetical protein [Escherichia coli]EGI7151012.1 hypothetical protein [Escherichia coli]EHW7469837.1 hypothetical protein [Escherichia coli]EHX8040608.1 hypothetical protein [Escherichia coli]
MTVHTLRQCRPDQEETEYFWKLFYAAQRNDARWHGSEIGFIAEELSRTDLDRNQKLFLLRAWQVLVDDKGGFGRFMGAFDTYVFNMQDPDDDCVAWKPELSKLLQDGDLLDVVLEAYTEAQRRIAELETENEYARNRFKEADLLFGKNLLVMQAAVIDWRATSDAKKGMAWIFNTLLGPGELPSEDEKDAQAYFDREYEPVDKELMELHRWFWERSERIKAERAAAGIAVKVGE